MEIKLREQEIEFLKTEIKLMIVEGRSKKNTKIANGIFKKLFNYEEENG